MPKLPLKIKLAFSSDVQCHKKVRFDRLIIYVQHSVITKLYLVVVVLVLLMSHPLPFCHACQQLTFTRTLFGLSSPGLFKV